MSQRDSGYERIELDAYQTPKWVTDALMVHLEFPLKIWEPACGEGQMVSALRSAYLIKGTDISGKPSVDFLKTNSLPPRVNAIVTNPPYSHAKEFIEHALDLMKPVNGIVAMLLRTDFDHAKSRQHLFAEHPAFAKKLVLTKRIQWFEHSTSAPSFNHAWMLWDWKHQGPPVIAYGPRT